MSFPPFSSVDLDDKSLHYLDSEQLENRETILVIRKKKTVVLIRGSKKWVNFKTHETGHCLRLKCVICQMETTANSVAS